jgi:hypothetical protein
MPVILATQEAEIRRIKVRSRPHSLQDPISKIPFTEKGLEEWLQIKALSSNPRPAKKKKKKKRI